VAARHPDWSPDAGQQVLDTLLAGDRLVLPALQALQHAFGYVHDEAVPLVASLVNVSVAEVHGVLTFYHDLRRTPPASVTVHLCTAEACQANGSRALVSDVEESLTKIGGRTSDGAVEVAEVFCLGQLRARAGGSRERRLCGRLNLDRLVAAVGAARAEVGA